MKAHLDQFFLREKFLKIFAFSALVTILYHVFVYLIESFKLERIFFINYITQCIKFIAFYLSIIPIKVTSIIYPDGYVYINSISMPFSKDTVVFVMEQIIVIFFISITIFSIYIILVWLKKLYKLVTTHKYKKSEFTRFSIALGITASIYYVLFIILTTSIIRSFK